MEIKECTKEYWDAFVDTSPQGTVYCRTVFLDNLGFDYDLIVALEKDVPQLGVIVLKDKGKVIPSSNFFVQYHGFLMKNDALNMPAHRLTQWLLETSNFLNEALSQKYDDILLCLHPSWYDLRPFLWFNYHAPDKGIFKVFPRYSARLQLNSFKNFDEYCASTRRDRRHQYRDALKQHLVTEVSDDMDELIRLDILTFKRQGLERSEYVLGLIKKITTSAVKNNYGRLLICKNTDGIVLSANLFLFDKNCAYYHSGANDPQYRDTSSGTFLVFEQIKYCFENNIPVVDFNGVNSPNRGDFKMSFNLSLTPYFIAEWSKPKI